MKLYLCRDGNNKSGDNWIYFFENVDNLDNYIDDGELTELFVDDCLGRFELSKLDAIVDNWISKLGSGGTIEIQDTDCYLVSKLFCKGILSLYNFNDFLMANKSAVSLVEIENMLRHKGLKIIGKKIFDDFLFSIKAEKV